MKDVANLALVVACRQVIDEIGRGNHTVAKVVVTRDRVDLAVVLVSTF